MRRRPRLALNLTVGFSPTPELSVAVANVHLAPTAPRFGQPTTVIAIVRNLGAAAAQIATAVLRIYADRREAAILHPLTFRVPAHRTIQLSWSAPAPAGKAIQIALVVSASVGRIKRTTRQTCRFQPPWWWLRLHRADARSAVDGMAACRTVLERPET